MGPNGLRVSDSRVSAACALVRDSGVSFETAIIQPRIQGQDVNLPVIAIFFSVMVGGQLFGVAGALLAVPCAAIVAIAIDQWLQVVGPR